MKKTEKNNKKLTRKEKGITLIALIVTIIVLIILAGIAISTISGNNGILNNTKETLVAREIGNFKEKVSMAQMSLKTEIAQKSASDNEYIATSSDNFEKLVEDVAKDFDVSAGEIIKESKATYKFASINRLQIATATSAAKVQKEGYTVSSSLDIIGNSSTDGHGYITIWYTSNSIRSITKKDKALSQYKLADAVDTSTDVSLSENQAMLVAIIHVKNNSSEFVTFDSNDESATNFGLTTIENATENVGKKLKETNYAVSTKEYSILTLNSNDETNEKAEEYMKVGNPYVVPENLYNREGYTFKKWNTLADGTGTDYNPGDLITDTNDNVQLNALWEAIEYTLSYELDGGTATNPSTYTIENNDFTLNKPSKDGYYFTGWTGSNGNTPQTDIVISKGTTGNKTYNANYAQYSQASLRTFNPTDSHVSWSFNTATGIYTITQSARSSGWGDGVVCDNSTTDIAWGKSYMLEFEIKVPNTYTLKTDGNTMFTSDGSGNDIYGTSWLIVDGIRTDGNGYGKLPQSTVINGGSWYKVQMYLINNNTTENPSHKAIRSYSGFALDLSSVASNVTYEMRNLKSIVY